MNSYLFPVIWAFFVSYLLTWHLASPKAALRILDRPGERSLHEQPTPRTGGLAIAAGILAALASLMVAEAIGRFDGLGRVAAGALLVGFVSLLDDWVGLSPIPRLMVHFAAAGFLVTGPWLPTGLDLPFVAWQPAPWLGGTLALIFTVWMVNLYNFMDGMDGFAGGMAVIGFGTLAIIGAAQEHVPFAVCNAAVAASALGFLIWNFPPARIFMGDTGSSTLGFLAAASLIWANHQGLLPLWLGVLIFSPFVVDATVTLVRRAFAGKRVWRAHRSHFYQRLVQLGWGHRATVLAEYLLMAGASLTALALYPYPNAWGGLLALVFWTTIFISLAVAVDHAERRSATRGG